MSNDPTSSLYDRPVLVLDPGMHTAVIRRADIDAAGRFAATASDDKTVRIWSLADGTLERTIRLPAGPGNAGKAFAVAMTPDGATIAAGGWTRDPDPDSSENVYLFDRASGEMVGRIEGLPEVVCHLAFSPAGDRLAVALGGGRGFGLYAPSGGGRWNEVAADTRYGDASYGVAFAPDGRLATTCLDGRLRLYGGDGTLSASVATLNAAAARARS